MIGHIGPEQPRWNTSRTVIDIPVEEIQRGPFSEEIGIRIRLDGTTKTAIVPTEAVDEENKVVRGTVIGYLENGKVILIALPPSSMGRTILQIKREVLEAITT